MASSRYGIQPVRSGPGGGSLKGGYGRHRLEEWAFKGALLFSITIGFVALAALIYKVLKIGLPGLSWHFVSSFPSSIVPAASGMLSAIVGTIYVMLLVIVFAVPIGIGAALYLEEYADRERWYNRLIETNIQNLAAVPSVVYGILGLAFIARGALSLGATLLTASLTLTLLALPIIIIASREAIRAVPSSIRDGSLALGATKWQTIWRQTLPAAIPGIATGSILAISRAIGESAPLLLLGAVTFVRFNPTSLDSGYTTLPLQIFHFTTQSQDAYINLAATGIIVLLMLLLTMNALAIWIRNRYQKRW